MNLKKSSSFLLGVLMLFSTMPARAVRSSDVSPSNSRSSERRLHHRDMSLSGCYNRILDEICRNKNDVKKLGYIYGRVVNKRETVRRRIEGLKSKRAPLWRRDRSMLAKLFDEQKYIQCAYLISYMYIVVGSIERSLSPEVTANLIVLKDKATYYKDYVLLSGSCDCLSSSYKDRVCEMFMEIANRIENFLAGVR